MSDEITMTPAELEGLQEIYGANDPDIKEAIELAAKAPEVTPTGTGEGEQSKENNQEGNEAPPADEKGDEVPPPGDTGAEKKEDKPEVMVPLKALHEERRKRQEAEARAEASQRAQGAPAQPVQPPQPQDMTPEEKFINGKPGEIAKFLFSKENGEYDPYNPDHQARLSELTSIVTVNQMRAGEMQRQVQAEREAFSREVLAWRDDVMENPEVEQKAMENYFKLPESSFKRVLAVAWDNLVNRRASKEDFNLVRDYFEEARQELKAPPANAQQPKASVDAAMGQPKTAGVGAGAGSKSDISVELIEAKLDKGIKLTPEEEKWIKNLV